MAGEDCVTVENIGDTLKTTSSRRLWGILMNQNPSVENNVRGRPCEICDKLWNAITKLFSRT
ncbi:unnamed protein product [Phyllotreta striolata]|uniref:Uncharacterized protein n=1 Tax=Phyllotreta striolata TaxID=444603 RepID=A0A9N9TIQ9_PHYSR|nr:unnamed protein product [Phyllotreta striolata]